MSRSESRRFLLEKAVLMPITTKAFWGGLDATAVPAPAALLLARPTASSISRVDTALSSDLRQFNFTPSHEIFEDKRHAYTDVHTVRMRVVGMRTIEVFDSRLGCLLNRLMGPRHLVQEILGMALS